jgi:phage I-like protein
MLRIRFLQAAVVLLAIMTAAGCGTDASAGNQDKQAADVAAARARAEASQAGDAAKKAMQSRLDELEHRIAALKADAKPADAKPAKAKHESSSEVNTLQSEVAELRAKLSTEQGRTQEWDKLKDATEGDFRKIEHKLDDLVASNKK